MISKKTSANADSNRLVANSHRSVASIIVVTFLMALIASVTIKCINDYSDRERTIEIALAEAKASANLLTKIEETAASGHQLSAAMRAQVTTTMSSIDRAMQPVRENANSTAAATNIEALTKAYRVALDKEFACLNQGSYVSSEEVASAEVDPAYAHLNAEIESAQRLAHRAAEKANLASDLGTFGVLLMSALMMSIVIRRFERAQGRNVRLVTEHEMLRKSENRFHALVRSASDVILIVDRDETITYASSAVSKVWGFAADVLVGESLANLLHDDERSRVNTLIAQVQSADGPVTTELLMRCSSDEFRATEVIVTDLFAEASVEGIVLNCRDITERKSFERQLAHQAFHDALTGLPNRALFNERLAHAVTRAKRTQSTLGVLFLDLDNFKMINDSLGHEAGDLLLMTVSNRLTACIRESDTVARLGGDEFTVLVDEVHNKVEVLGLAERISDILRLPIVLNGREVFISASIGIAISAADGRQAEELLRDADTAMYQAKSSGKSQCVVFDNSMNARVLERLELETDIRKALVNNEFIVHYQPIIEIETGRIVEVEALVRWQHPVHGILAPAMFIPIAEETGLIVPLGRWVMETACKQARAWQIEYPGEPLLTVSVNLSARQLQRDYIVEEVVEVLKVAGIAATQLKIEITESVMIIDPELTIPKLNRLTALGVRLAVDDFGTGYSSMSYLSSMPIDTLKIDRSFVSKIGTHKEDEAIIRAIVTLAKTLNLSITSEGIETEEQRTHLQSLGCEMGQGYFYAKPAGPGELTALLARQRNTESDLDLIADLSPTVAASELPRAA